MDIEQSEIIRLIYDTIESPQHWQQVMERICQQSDSNHTFIATRSSVDEQPLGFYANGFEDGHFERYHEHFYQVDVWTKSLAHRPFNEFHASHEVFHDPSFLNTEIYNDFAKPANIRHSIGCLLTPADDQIITELAFMRGKGQEYFDRATIQKINNYLPHIKQSLALSQKLLPHQQASRCLNQVLDVMDDPVIICTGRDQLYFVNDAAESLLKTPQLFRTNMCLSNQKSTLMFQCPIAQEKFLEAAQNCLDSLEGISTRLTQEFKARFYLTHDEVHYRVQVQPWLQRQMTPWGEHAQPGVLITLSYCAVHKHISAREILEHFELTQSEADICKQLVNGYNLNQIAEARNATLGTVRQQVKSCLLKTDAPNQQTLINKLLRRILVD
jgi:DNA-binding NarL/FixJ family response regulator